MTILFCDLVNYSGLAEKLDLEQQTAVVREYHRVTTEIIKRHGGFVAQYLGDGSLSYFGYPLSHENSAERAIDAALEMVRAIENLAELWPQEHLDLQARVGVHAGVALIGHEQLAVGPTVNCASRVQERARAGTVLVTGAVYRTVRGYFDFVAQGEHTLKGFAKPFKLYEVTNRTGARDRIEAARTVGLAPFVDRHQERGVLRECWQLSEHALSSVLLTGEPGIGKSRTLLEFRTEIQSDQPAVLEARCSEMHRDSVLFPLLELLRAELEWTAEWTREQTHARLLERLGASHGDKAELLTALLLGDAHLAHLPLATTPAVLRERMLEAVIDWICATAHSQRVLFVLEDIHWADATTLEACSLLMSHTATPRIMIVTSARADFSGSWPTGQPSRIVSLERLPDRDVETLIDALTRAETLPQQTLQIIRRDSDGNPLFVEEITRDVLELGAQRAGGEESSVPLTLRSALRARLDRLGRLKRVAQQAAVAGREFDAQLLSSAFGWQAEEAAALLSNLVVLGIIMRRTDRGADRYEFRHALIHNEAYEALGRKVARGYHAQIAEALLRTFPVVAEREPEVLGHHFEKSGQLEKAVRAYHQAGERAIERSSFVEARAMFERALTTLADIPHSEERDRLEVDVRSGLGLVLLSTKGFTAPDVEGTYQRCVELSERVADVPLRVLYGLWAFNMVRGDRFGTARLVPHLERAQARTSCAHEELITSACLGSYSFFRGEFDAAEALLLRSWALCRREEPGAQNAQLLRDYGFEGMLYAPTFLAWMRLFQGRVSESTEFAAEAVRVADASKNPYLIAMALGCAGSIAHDTGRPELAGELGDRLLTVAQESRLPYWLASGLCVKGLASVRAGQLSEGQTAISQGLFLFKAIGAFLVYPYYVCYLAQALIAAGELEQASALLDETTSVVDRTLNCTLVTALWYVMSEVAAKRGKTQESAQLLQQILDAPVTRVAPAFGLRAVLRMLQLPPTPDRKDRAGILRLLDTHMAAVVDCPELDEARRLRNTVQ